MRPHHTQSAVRPTVQTNPSRKTELFEKSLETGGALNAGFHFNVEYDPVSLKHKSRVAGDCCVFSFLRRSVVWTVFNISYEGKQYYFYMILHC